MKREQLIEYLLENACFKDNSFVVRSGQWYRNCINSHSCLIPFDEELGFVTCCHIFYELKVAAPPEFESDYEVYKLWREQT